MGHKNKRSLFQQAYDRLQSMAGYGRSKYEDKKAGISGKYIYSFNSMKTYQKHINYFLHWCKDSKEVRQTLGHTPRSLDECQAFVEPYIRDREAAGLSAYTVKLEKSALSKLYQTSFDFQTINTRRADITRSRRENTVGDAHFSEKNNKDLINACRCVGFRRSELEAAKAEDLWEINGIYFMNIRGKGGRIRAAQLYGTAEEIENAVAYIRNLSGHNHIHSNADIHSYRADYASRVYRAHARDLSQLKGRKIDYTALTGKTAKDGSHIYKNAIYHCRGDQKGQAMDRTAMIIASQNLGHNREDVVGEHYLKLQ